MKKMTYREKFIQINKEAKYTFITAFILIAWWWLAGFGTSKIDYVIMHMPGWFVLSCFGIWFLSIVSVVILVRTVFQDFSLEDVEDIENIEDVENDNDNDYDYKNLNLKEKLIKILENEARK